MSTGYSTARAAPHEIACEWVIACLRHRNYSVKELDVDGHRPDIFVDGVGFLDVKTSMPQKQNLAIEIDSLDTYRRIQSTEGVRVYIAHVRVPADPETWTVDTPDSISARIIQGPRRHSGLGSNDDWYLVGKGGTSFTEFFPSRPGLRAA